MIEYMEDILRSIINLDNTFIGEVALDVDNCQWIRSDGGISRIHFEDQKYNKPNYRVYVRNISNEQARNTMYQIYNKLKDYRQDNYVILADRLPHFVGRDVKNRAIYSVLIEIQLGGN